jgi:hypothetical protein
MTDVMVFGETGLLAACRGASGKAETISYGGVTSPRGHKGGITMAEVKATSSGTIAMRGPMVPRAPFPPGAERSGFPHLKIGANGLVDTGYGCHADSASIIVTGPPPGMISVGGYRFMIEQVQELIKRMDAEGQGCRAARRLCGTSPRRYCSPCAGGAGCAGTAAHQSIDCCGLPRENTGPGRARVCSVEHDLEKWDPVFGKDHAPQKAKSGMTIRRRSAIVDAALTTIV